MRRAPYLPREMQHRHPSEERKRVMGINSSRRGGTEAACNNRSLTHPATQFPRVWLASNCKPPVPIENVAAHHTHQPSAPTTAAVCGSAAANTAAPSRAGKNYRYRYLSFHLLGREVGTQTAQNLTRFRLRHRINSGPPTSIIKITINQ